jgi:hypothetical protein
MNPIFTNNKISKHKEVPELDRFWAKVDVVLDETSCWDWNAARDKDGYGKIGAHRVTFKSHRLSWEYQNGPIPEGLCVCHKCDNPSCVRPDHLFTETAQKNNLDKELKNRQTRGTKNGMHILTEEDVRSIRKMYSTGQHSQITLSEMYGVTQSCISKIVRNKRWLHVDNELVGKRKEEGLSKDSTKQGLSG